MTHNESKLQRVCVQWFRVQYPHLVLFAIPNGGRRGKVEASIMKGEGVLAVLSEAMAGTATSGDGFRHVKFTFKGDSNPVIITCKEYESMALIMPYLIGESSFQLTP